MLPCFTYGCAHPYGWAWGFLCFLPALRPPSGSWSTGSSGFSSPLGFPTFAMGPPLRGRGSFVLDRNEGLVTLLGQVHWSVPGWTSHLCLRVSARPVPQGVLPSGPRCVHELRLSLDLSSVLHCPLLGFGVTSPALARGLGCLWYPTLISAGWGWCLGRWLSFAPCSRWCPLSGWSSLWLQVVGGSWFSPLCSPDRRSTSRSTCPALPPVSGLSFRLGDFSFG